MSKFGPDNFVGENKNLKTFVLKIQNNTIGLFGGPLVGTAVSVAVVFVAWFVLVALSHAPEKDWSDDTAETEHHDGHDDHHPVIIPEAAPEN